MQVVRGLGLIGKGEDPIEKAITMDDPLAAASFLREQENNRIRQIPFRFLQLEHLFFHCVSRDQPVSEDRTRLSDAVSESSTVYVFQALSGG